MTFAKAAPEDGALLSWDEFMAAPPVFSDDDDELDPNEPLSSLSLEIEADTLRHAEDGILFGLPALITVAGDAAHLSLSDSDSASDDDDDEALEDRLRLVRGPTAHVCWFL